MPVNVQLPSSGPGFVTHNRGNNGQNQFGQQSTIDAVMSLGDAWNPNQTDRPFSIGHISRNGGGNFPPHDSHRFGLDIDVRPMRLDGQNAEVTIHQAQYDPVLTKELIELWWEKTPVQLILFNDPDVIAAGLSRFFDNHHHHFHVRLRKKDATIKIGDRGSDVAEVQTILGMLEVDGRFGPITQNAVEEFQLSNGLEPDGVVGRNTWAALREAPPPP